MSKEFHTLFRPSSASQTKRIATSQLKIGMFLVGVYQSWWKSPFFRHNRLLKTQKEIDLLHQSGVKEVMIDPSRGGDVDDGPETYGPSEEFRRIDDEEQMSDEPEESELFEGQEELDIPSSLPVSPIEAAELVRSQTIMAVESIFEGVKTGEVIDQPKLQQTVQSLLDQVLSQGEAMVEAILLQNLQAFDKSLYGHVVDVAILSVMVGLQLGFEKDALQTLALGGLLHDVGHVRIPRNVLRRRYHLIGEEQALFERHVELGLSILACCPTIPSEVHRVVAEHHERQDGSGYPQCLDPAAISPLSDVVGLIDQFDVLVSQWGPPPSAPTALAVRQLYQDAKLGKFRTVGVEALIRCLGVYPIGSFVALSTGERAVVLKTNAHERLKPMVKIITDNMGKLYDTPLVEDLALPSSSKGERTIQSILDPAKYKIDVGKYFSSAK